MLPPCDNSSVAWFPNDVDASSPPSNNIISHKVELSSQDQRKQPLVDRCLFTSNPDISQPSGVLSNPVVRTTITWFVYPTSHMANTNRIPLWFCPVMNSSFVHAVATSLPNNDDSLLSMGELCIPCPSCELSRLKPNHLLNPCHLQRRRRIHKNSEALDTALLLFSAPRIR